jgi:hypothetical protein
MNRHLLLSPAIFLHYLQVRRASFFPIEGMRRKVYPLTPCMTEYLILPAKTIQAMDYLYMLLKFVIGGSIIVGVTLLAEHADLR